MYLRKYAPGDCKALAELFYNTVHTVNARDYSQAQLDAWATGAVDLDTWNRSFLAHMTIVAVEDGIIVGFGDMDGSGYLDRLYVHAAYQGQGVATAICDELERVIPGTHTTHASITARPFFEHRGYRVIKEQQVERKGVKLTNFVMERTKQKKFMPKIRITKANPADFESVRSFYHTHIDQSQDSPFDIGWKKGIYPSDTYLREALASGELFVGIMDEQIISAMILDHHCNADYEKAQWTRLAKPEEVLVIHALGVLPAWSGHGIGKAMVDAALKMAKAVGCKAMRLDVLRGNVPAVKLYTRAGFCLVDTLSMFYEDTGWTEFELYERLLS